VPGQLNGGSRVSPLVNHDAYASLGLGSKSLSPFSPEKKIKKLEVSSPVEEDKPAVAEVRITHPSQYSSSPVPQFLVSSKPSLIPSLPMPMIVVHSGTS